MRAVEIDTSRVNWPQTDVVARDMRPNACGSGIPVLRYHDASVSQRHRWGRRWPTSTKRLV